MATEFVCLFERCIPIYGTDVLKMRLSVNSIAIIIPIGGAHGQWFTSSADIHPLSAVTATQYVDILAAALCARRIAGQQRPVGRYRAILGQLR
jgi:hypothetical protein